MCSKSTGPYTNIPDCQANCQKWSCFLTVYVEKTKMANFTDTTSVWVMDL